MFSSYTPLHAAPSSSRRNASAAVLVTGLTATLGLPALASPAAAAVPAGTTPTTAPLALPVLTHPVPAAPAVGAATVRFGSRGAAVTEVQRILGISADGVFGPQTRGAVLSFQSSKGLAADGIVGPRTWGALRGGTAPAAATERASRGAERSSTVASSVIAEAARHAGKPYRYGAAGPDAFDCSGFTQYVFAQFGISLPHSSAAQHDVSTKVDKSDLRVGDLVFMKYGGRISHVGIYAGDNTMWVARRSGTTVTQQTIWTSDFLVGRVG